MAPSAELLPTFVCLPASDAMADAGADVDVDVMRSERALTDCWIPLVSAACSDGALLLLGEGLLEASAALGAAAGRCVRSRSTSKVSVVYTGTATLASRSARVRTSILRRKYLPSC